jgi:hypothetical protein
MATDNRRKKTSRRPASSRSESTATSARRSIGTRAGRAIKDRPATTAAVTTGIVAGIAAGIAGFLAFKKSGKTFGEFSDDVATRVKDGLADAKTRASEMVDRRKDGIDEPAAQTAIAEEALTLKETGKKAKRPVDPTIEDELKTGAISY